MGPAGPVHLAHATPHAGEAGASLCLFSHLAKRWYEWKQLSGGNQPQPAGPICPTLLPQHSPNPTELQCCWSHVWEYLVESLGSASVSTITIADGRYPAVAATAHQKQKGVLQVEGQAVQASEQHTASLYASLRIGSNVNTGGSERWPGQLLP